MAANPVAAVDPTVIRRFVVGMVAELTDTRNIQALIDPPPGLTSTSPSMQAIADRDHEPARAAFCGPREREHSVPDQSTARCSPTCLSCSNITWCRGFRP